VKEVKVRSLEVNDLGMLHEWMNKPHLRPYYMWGDISLEDVRSKFIPRIEGEDDCRSLIAEFDESPLGYIQWYYNRSDPDYGVAREGFMDGVSFDYFVGETAFLGKQLGSAILLATIEYVAAKVEEDDRDFFLIHAEENARAIRCSERAGFQSIAKMTYSGLPSKIYRRGP